VAARRAGLVRPVSVTTVRPSVVQRCGGRRCPEGTCDHRGRAARQPGVPPIVYEVLGSQGRPLDAGVRAALEPRLGHDFSGVRLHTDAKAVESARAVDAAAYTLGNRIAFAAGRYTPGTAAGDQLLVHELMHTIQQRTGAGARPGFWRISSADEPAEREAAAADNLESRC
jgi:Domain of unknown function (DUF4157)